MTLTSPSAAAFAAGTRCSGSGSGSFAVLVGAASAELGVHGRGGECGMRTAGIRFCGWSPPPVELCDTRETSRQAQKLVLGLSR